MHCSSIGLAHIAKFEGLSLKLYNDPGGHCTIGVGHLVHLGPIDGRASETPFNHGISKQRALNMLAVDAARFEDCVNQSGTPPLTQHQFDALVSLAFNVGCGGLRRSPVLRAVKAGRDPRGVWLKYAVTGVGSSKVLGGLVRRRAAEAKLYGLEEEEDEDMATIIKIKGTTKTYLVRGGKPKPIPTRKMRDELQEAYGIPMAPVVVSQQTFNFLNS